MGLTGTPHSAVRIYCGNMTRPIAQKLLLLRLPQNNTEPCSH